MTATESLQIDSRKSKTDIAFAFITLFLGYALARAMIFSEPGVGITIYAVIFVAMGGLYMKLQGVKPSAASVVPPVIMIAFSAVMVISGVSWVRQLTVLFEILVAVYWFLAAFGLPRGGQARRLFAVPT